MKNTIEKALQKQKRRKQQVIRLRLQKKLKTLVIQTRLKSRRYQLTNLHPQSFLLKP